MKKYFSEKIRNILPKRKVEIDKTNEIQEHLLNLPNDLARILKAYRENKEPGYALLITGDWGSGKTHQITKKYLLPDSYYHISLFGLKTADEIHANVFSAMYPFKSFLKNKANTLSETGIDAYGISINLGNIAPQLISAFVKNKPKKDRIIIFDDFERCNAPVNERLGAINTYVERSECHVIVISNDEKISSQEFSEAKEKVFGVTYKVTSDRSEVFDSFLEKFKENKNIDFVIKQKEEILETLEIGQINSLRVLKQVIFDIFNLYSCLEKHHLKNEIFLLKITRFFTAISAEVRIGNFKREELLDRVNHSVRHLMAGSDSLKTNEIEKRFNASQEKYIKLGIRLDDEILNDEILLKSLINGIFDKNKIIESINLSEFYHSASKLSNWRRMMDFDKLDDSTTNNIIADLNNEFQNRELTHPGDILHLMALRLLMSRTNQIETDIDKTTDECLAYIEDIYTSEKLQLIDLDLRTSYRLREVYDGYGYYVPDYNKTHFNAIYEFLTLKINLANKNSIIKKSSDIINMLRVNTQEFINNISYGHNSDGKWAEKPILKYIDVNDFIQAFLASPRKFWHDIQYSLERRYESSIKNSLISEVDWVISLVDRFEDEIKITNGIKRLRLERATPFKIKELALSVKKNIKN